MKRIVHIAPTLPPAINGLGDFCKILADNLEREGITNIFLVRNVNSLTIQENVHVFDADTFRDVLEKEKPDVIILHYVGYAYDKYALPFYIVRALERYKRKFQSKFIVFFHELYSSSKSLLRLPFYTSWLQQMIVRQLLLLADKVFTNCTVYSKILQEVAGYKRQSNFVECTGIFSNISDDLFNANIPKEDGSLVVFGSCSRRQSVYANPSFSALLKDLEIKTVYDIGPGNASCDNGTVSIVKKGSLESAELAHYFNRAKYGVLNYKRELLGKSGIFSAYAAFGIIPINLGKSPGPLNDNLVEGLNYFDYGSIRKIDTLKLSTEKVLAWYKTRDQRTITEKVKRHLL